MSWYKPKWADKDGFPQTATLPSVRMLDDLNRIQAQLEMTVLNLEAEVNRIEAEYKEEENIIVDVDWVDRE